MGRHLRRRAARDGIAYDDAETAGLAIAVNQGSAAETFGLALDDVARIEPA